MECIPTNKVSRLVYNVCNILNESFHTKPTVAASPKGAGVRFCNRIKQIVTKAEREDSTDIVMTVPFDEKTLTWKTDSNGQAQS